MINAFNICLFLFLLNWKSLCLKYYLQLLLLDDICSLLYQTILAQTSVSDRQTEIATLTALLCSIAIGRAPIMVPRQNVLYDLTYLTLG
jgi:hypothetical protein